MTHEPGHAQRLTVLVPAHAHTHHHSVVTEVLSRARKAQLAGATVLEAFDAGGRRRERHAHSLLRDDAVLSVLIVEEPDKLARFLEENQALLEGVPVTLDDVTAFRA